MGTANDLVNGVALLNGNEVREAVKVRFENQHPNKMVFLFVLNPNTETDIWMDQVEPHSVITTNALEGQVWRIRLGSDPSSKLLKQVTMTHESKQYCVVTEQT